MRTHKDADGGGVDLFEAADVDSLGIVAQPVAEVNATDVHGGPFFAVEEAHRREHVLDVCRRSVYERGALTMRGQRTSMPPVVALNLSNGRDVAGAERGGAVREDNEQEAEDQEHGAPAHSKFCHVVAGM
jgi:hypothetical protein